MPLTDPPERLRDLVANDLAIRNQAACAQDMVECAELGAMLAELADINERAQALYRVLQFGAASPPGVEPTWNRPAGGRRSARHRRRDRWAV